MRPPHYAGENDVATAFESRQTHASMRPPHYAGENATATPKVTLKRYASMRPPHYAGENRCHHFAPEFHPDWLQ